MNKYVLRHTTTLPVPLIMLAQSVVQKFKYLKICKYMYQLHIKKKTAFFENEAYIIIVVLEHYDIKNSNSFKCSNKPDKQYVNVNIVKTENTGEGWNPINCASEIWSKLRWMAFGERGLIIYVQFGFN